MRPTGCTTNSQPDYKDMIYAETKPEIEAKRKAFIRNLTSGQITMRKVDGRRSLAEKPCDRVIDLAA